MSKLPCPLLFVAAFVLPLAACSSGPQQPSDVVDDKTAESPYLGDDSAPGADSPPFTDIAEVPPVDDPAAVPRRTDPIETGSATAEMADISAVEGRWAVDSDACALEDGPAVVISRRRYETPDRSCDVADLIDAGDGAVTVTLSCAGSDEAASELIKLTPADGQLGITVIGGDEPDQHVVRCP